MILLLQSIHLILILLHSGTIAGKASLGGSLGRILVDCGCSGGHVARLRSRMLLLLLRLQMSHRRRRVITCPRSRVWRTRVGKGCRSPISMRLIWQTRSRSLLFRVLLRLWKSVLMLSMCSRRILVFGAEANFVNLVVA